MELDSFSESFTPDIMPPEGYNVHTISVTGTELSVDLLFVTYVYPEHDHTISVNAGTPTKATAVIGNPATANGHVDVTHDIAGTLGNKNKILVQNGVAEGSLFAQETTNGITLTLGMDNSNPPVPDNTKNTASLIATVINALDDYTAIADGNGSVAPAIAHDDQIAFSGGTSTILVDLIHVDDIPP